MKTIILIFLLISSFLKAEDYIYSDDDKFWTLLQRANSNASARVGVANYLNGTEKYKKFKGLKCNYAVKYMDDSTYFYRHKCSL